jgi:hypothetical protein
MELPTRFDGKMILVKSQGYQIVQLRTKIQKSLPILNGWLIFDGMLKEAICRPREGPACLDWWISPFVRFSAN